MPGSTVSKRNQPVAASFGTAEPFRVALAPVTAPAAAVVTTGQSALNVRTSPKAAPAAFEAMAQ